MQDISSRKAFPMKTEFIVSDMTCNHCVQTITKAVQAVSPGATVAADLAAHRVSIEALAEAVVLQAAIADEGYDVQPA
jgi:copper chaperone